MGMFWLPALLSFVFWAEAARPADEVVAAMRPGGAIVRELQKLDVQPPTAAASLSFREPGSLLEAHLANQRSVASHRHILKHRGAEPGLDGVEMEGAGPVVPRNYDDGFSEAVEESNNQKKEDLLAAANKLRMRGQDVPSRQEFESKELFKKTSAGSVALKSATVGIDQTIHRVDKAIDRVDGAMTTYHKSINSLSDQFGTLHNMASDMHATVLNELKDREAARMCAFANVERQLKGEAIQPCGRATSNGDYSSHFSESVAQPGNEKLSETGAQPADADAEVKPAAEETHGDRWAAITGDSPE